MEEFKKVIKEFNRLCSANITEQGVCGGDCPFFDKRKCNGYSSCNSYIVNHCSEAEEIIMKWASENPIQTNADKFKEVFGFIPDSEYCPDKCPENGCANCEYRHFWSQEYKEPKGE